MRRGLTAAVELVPPMLLVVLAALVGTGAGSNQTYFVDALVNVAIVVGLYVFIGNAGVLSFGHISFFAVGAWTAGVLTMSAASKPAVMPGLAHFLRVTTVGNVPSLLLAAAVGAAAAIVVGLPLMRLSGLAAGIATFAVLEIAHNVLQYYEKIGPGLNAFSAVPQTTGVWQAAVGALIAIVVAYGYQRTRFGRMLRAARDDAAAATASGISIYRQRLVAFVLSAALVGFAGGLEVHFLPVSASGVYLDLTFSTLAMLVVGGLTSLWGAVLGALVVSALDSWLAAAENGTSLFGAQVDLPSGTRLVVVGVLMAAVLVLRPSGLTGGREFPTRWVRR